MLITFNYVFFTRNKPGWILRKDSDTYKTCVKVQQILCMPMLYLSKGLLSMNLNSLILICEKSERNPWIHSNEHSMFKKELEIV